MANNSSHNTSEFHQYGDYIGWYWFRVFFITITAFLDIACNIISLIVLPKMKCLPSNNRFLVMISSALDLGTGFIASMSIAPAVLDSWPYSDSTCLVYAIAGAFTTSTTVILVIGALDRYIAIKKPLHYHLIVTKTRLIIICSIFLIIQLACVFISLFTIKLTYNRNLCICNASYNVNITFVIGLVIFNGMNLFTVALVYLQLFRVVREVTRANHVRNTNNNNTRNNTKAVRMFFVYSGTYVCAMVPFTISTFSLNSGSVQLPYQFEFLSVWFLYSYPWWNVGGLALVNSNFRRLIYKTFCFQ